MYSLNRDFSISHKTDVIKTRWYSILMNASLCSFAMLCLPKIIWVSHDAIWDAIFKLKDCIHTI